MPPTVPPITRILRTLLQILGAIGIVVPSVVALLGQAGIDVDGAALVALVAAAVLVVTTLMNALESAGLIPTIGERAPVDSAAQIGESVEGAPLFTASEVRDILAGSGSEAIATARLHAAIRAAKSDDL